MDTRIVHYIGFTLGSTVAALLAIALLTQKKNRLANRILALILLWAVQMHFVAALVLSGDIVKVPLALRSAFPFTLATSPLFYFYIEAMTVPGFRLERRLLIHGIPFLIGLIWVSYFLVQYPTSSAYWQLASPEFEWERYLRICVVSVNIAFYWVLSFQTLRRYQHSIKDYFSTEEGVRLDWLRLILFNLLFLWIICVVDVLSGPRVDLGAVSAPALTLTILLMGLFALRQSVLFTWEPPQKAEFDAEQEAKNPKERSRRPPLLSPEALEKAKLELQRYLDESKPYLNPQLRLSDLSRGLGRRPQEISDVLNRGMGVCFYDLINRYRIEEARQRLVDPRYTHLNILGIATDCGFNSKSTFNDTFKKATGLTPSEFIETAKRS